MRRGSLVVSNQAIVIDRSIQDVVKLRDSGLVKCSWIKGKCIQWREFQTKDSNLPDPVWFSVSHATLNLHWVEMSPLPGCNCRSSFSWSHAFKCYCLSWSLRLAPTNHDHYSIKVSALLRNVSFGGDSLGKSLAKLSVVLRLYTEEQQNTGLVQCFKTSTHESVKCVRLTFGSEDFFF